MSSYMNREMATMVAAIVALLGVVYLFNENKKMKSVLGATLSQQAYPQPAPAMPPPSQSPINQGPAPQQAPPTPVIETNADQVKK